MQMSLTHEAIIRYQDSELDFLEEYIIMFKNYDANDFIIISTSKITRSGE